MRLGLESDPQLESEPWLGQRVDALLSRARTSGVPDEAEGAAWRKIRYSARSADFVAFLRDYPSGRFADAARQNLTIMQGGAQEHAPKPSPAAALLRVQVMLGKSDRGQFVVLVATESGIEIRGATSLMIPWAEVTEIRLGGLVERHVVVASAARTLEIRYRPPSDLVKRLSVLWAQHGGPKPQGGTP